MQQRLAEGKRKYSYGAYNKYDSKEQYIRITEGCPNNCPYCYKPTEYKVFDVPEIVRNDVKIMDMNLLCKRRLALAIIEDLGSKIVNGKVVYYELICGIDYRFLTSRLAEALKKNRFKNIRLAWDWGYKDQKLIKNAIDMLLNAGYKDEEIMVFIICNWKISYEDNLRKMDLCKVWNFQIADCWFDNQVFPKRKEDPPIKPIHWKFEECIDFRSKVRKHNQLINFRIDPELKPSEFTSNRKVEE